MLRILRLYTLALVTTLWSRLRHGPVRPSWTFGLEFLWRFLCLDWRELRDWAPARARADLEARFYNDSPLARRTSRQADVLGGVACEWFVPPGTADGPVLLHVHGGGFTGGSSRTHADLLARLALASGLRVLAPNYRLAPEHPFPAPVDDVLACWRDLLARGTRPDEVVVSGESAGGSIALALLLRLRDGGLPLPAGAVLMSPLVDFEGKSPSVRANAAFDWGDADLVLGMARAYAGSMPLDDPRLALVGAELGGLCPLLVQVGGVERLHDEGVALAERARRAGVDVTLDVLPETPHAGQLLAMVCAEGRRAIERAAAFATSRVAANPQPAVQRRQSSAGG